MSDTTLPPPTQRNPDHHWHIGAPTWQLAQLGIAQLAQPERATAQSNNGFDALLKLGWLGARPRARFTLKLYFLPLLHGLDVGLGAARQVEGACASRHA